MKNIVISLCIVVGIITVVECDQKFCAHSCMDVGRDCALKLKSKDECFTKSTGCIDNGSFQSNCVNPKTIELSDSMKQLFLDTHNEKRNQIASGAVRGYGPACRMATMQWDDELSEMAAMLGHKCDMEHDTCRRTSKFFSPGQNLFRNYIPINFAHLLDVREQIVHAAQAFYDEISFSKPSDMDSLPGYSYAYGHFIAMVAESSTHLGCGIVTYDIPTNDRSYMLIICNYARSNMFGLPVFTKCPVAGSNCTTGTDKKYPNLCSTQEKYDVNYYTEYDIWDWDWDKKYKS